MSSFCPTFQSEPKSVVKVARSAGGMTDATTVWHLHFLCTERVSMVVPRPLVFKLLIHEPLYHKLLLRSMIGSLL